MDDEIIQTINIYKKLGKRYLTAAAPIIIPELSEFIREVKVGGLILDVGCAGGRDSRKFVDAGFRVVGIDLTEEFLEEARKFVPEGEFLYMDVRRLTFSPDTFDGIWACAVLLHIHREEILNVLKDFYRVLKVNGVLDIRVKEGRGEKFITDSLSPIDARYFIYYSIDEITNLLRQSGFTIINGPKIVADEMGREDTQWVSVRAKKSTINNS